MRALIIDDDPTIREMLDLVLTLEGFEVDLASDGVQGVASAEAVTPDVIVLDVMMPDVTGWDVAARLAEHPRLSHVPIVFCTAMAGEQETWRGWQLGAASYVPKPFDNDRLVDEVLRAIATTAEVAA